VKALDDSSADIREAADSALERFRDEHTLEPMEKRMKIEDDEEVKNQLKRAITKIKYGGPNSRQ
jgi:HEAT repeat protein